MEIKALVILGYSSYNQGGYTHFYIEDKDFQPHKEEFFREVKEMGYKVTNIVDKLFKDTSGRPYVDLEIVTNIPYKEYEKVTAE